MFGSLSECNALSVAIRNDALPLETVGDQSSDDRSCEGFRMPALARAVMQGRRLGAGVGKPPREETAGRRGAGGEGRPPMGIWRLVERRRVVLVA